MWKPKHAPFGCPKRCVIIINDSPRSHRPRPSVEGVYRLISCTEQYVHPNQFLIVPWNYYFPVSGPSEPSNVGGSCPSWTSSSSSSMASGCSCNSYRMTSLALSCQWRTNPIQGEPRVIMETIIASINQIPPGEFLRFGTATWSFPGSSRGTKRCHLVAWGYHTCSVMPSWDKLSSRTLLWLGWKDVRHSRLLWFSAQWQLSRRKAIFTPD